MRRNAEIGFYGTVKFAEAVNNQKPDSFVERSSYGAQISAA
jgi:hypothetical protein